MGLLIFLIIGLVLGYLFGTCESKGTKLYRERELKECYLTGYEHGYKVGYETGYGDGKNGYINKNRTAYIDF